MTGRPTGEVEAGSAESAEVAETADGLGAAGSCWTTAVGGSLGGSVTVEAWSRLPTGGGEPGAASVMTPILRGVPVQTLVRRKEPRGNGGLTRSSLRRKLKRTGYQNKTCSGRSPATYLALTSEGRVAFERYVRNLRALLDA